MKLILYFIVEKFSWKAKQKEQQLLHKKAKMILKATAIIEISVGTQGIIAGIFLPTTVENTD